MLDYWTRNLRDEHQALEKLVDTDYRPSPEDCLHLFRNNVELIHLELSSRCNRKCNYCPVATSDRQTRQDIMDDALLESILADLTSVDYRNTVNLNLYNEPLLNPQLTRHIAMIRQALPKAYVTVNTNGDALNARIQKELSDAGLNYLCVTLHPKPDTVISPDERERRVMKLIDKLGYVPNHRMNLAEQLQIAGNITFRLNGVAMVIQWPDWNVDGSSRGGEVVVLDIGKMVRTQPCVRPYREFCIYYDGSVTPCCEVFHDGTRKSQRVGQISADETTSLFSVYASRHLTAFRRSVFSYGAKDGVCKLCTYADCATGSDEVVRDAILQATESLPARRLAG